MTLIKYFLIIVSITILFALTSNETKAQCPSGYTFYELPMNINGCDYLIQVCVKCGIGPIPATISLQGIILLYDPPCTQQWSFEQVANYVRNTITAPHFIFNTFCLQGSWNVRPCNDPPHLEIHYTEPICWNITKVSYFGEDKISYWPCQSDAYCLIHYTICFNTMTQQFDKTSIFEGIVGEVDCTLGPEEVDIPSEYNKPSECFIYPTACQ